IQGEGEEHPPPERGAEGRLPPLDAGTEARRVRTRRRCLREDREEAQHSAPHAPWSAPRGVSCAFRAPERAAPPLYVRAGPSERGHRGEVALDRRWLGLAAGERAKADRELDSAAFELGGDGERNEPVAHAHAE